MTVNQVINRVNRVKPNAFAFIDKARWISEVEGMIQTEVMLLAPAEVVTYGSGSGKCELLVPPPWDKLYESYLVARIDFANGEYDKYANTSAMFNKHYEEFTRWFADTYRPADKTPPPMR